MRRRLLSILCTLLAFVGVIVADTGTAHADAPILMGSVLYGSPYNQGVNIWSDQDWFIGNNLNTVTYVTFQGDGNLVVYNSPHTNCPNNACWASNTAGITPPRALLKLQGSDGNWVIYKYGGGVAWADNHYANGSYRWALNFYNNMCLNKYQYYSGAWHFVWSPFTFGNQLTRCDSIRA